MQRKFRLLVLFIFAASALPGTSAVSDFERIRQRVTESLLKGESDDAHVKILVESFRADSTWPGIDYSDLSREGFQHSRHSSALVTLARAYNLRSSDYFKSKKVKATIEAALAYWVRNDFFCDNWWHNQIGTPNNLVAVMLLIGDKLPEELVAKTQPIIGRAHLDASGARPSGDRIKIAGILAKNLLFNGDKVRFDQVVRVIEGELKFSTGFRGMQHDYSFHHREDRVNNTLSYGQGYAEAFAEWAAYVAGTEYAFSETKINQLVDYYLDGMCKQMVFGKFSDTGIKNRDISRRESGRGYGSSTPERLMLTTSYRKGELEDIIKIREGEVAEIPSFSKFFWQTEHYVHQRPGWYTSVRMHSTRNRNMEEPYNSEGLKNHHRGDGTNHISMRGDEYLNIAPVLDWQKIPGTTILQKPELPAASEIQKEGLTDFVGAVTNGLYGAVGYDFRSPHDPLSTRKAWFFFDEAYVCLGTSIKSRTNLPVVTTLNQCFLRGDVTVGTAAGSKVLEKGEHQPDQVSWVYHDGIAYLFPEPQKVNLSNQTQSGSWYSINKQTDSPKEEISLDVFKLWIDHGNRPGNGVYQYIVMPGVKLEQMSAGIQNNLRILSNTSSIQAVHHSGVQISQVVFYKAGTITLPGDLILSAANPGIVMVKTEGPKVVEISVADPNRELTKFHFSLSSRIGKVSDQFNAAWNAGTGMTDICVSLPEGVYQGQSVILSF